MNSSNNNQVENVNVLWTGGWDSSFRVLYLVLVENRVVQPYYIVDLGRKSSLRELQAIQEIKQALEHLDPKARERILPHKITVISDIPQMPAITDAYKRLRETAYLGTQYDWLSRFAEANELDGLELSIHADDKAHAFVEPLAVKTPEGWRINRTGGDVDIFARFSFPLLELTKQDMADAALRYGFADCLNLSWFCYSPARGQPCGTCNPCRYTIEEGMSQRFDVYGRLRYRARHIYAAKRKLMKVLGRR